MYLIFYCRKVNRTLSENKIISFSKNKNAQLNNHIMTCHLLCFALCFPFRRKTKVDDIFSRKYGFVLI